MNRLTQLHVQRGRLLERIATDRDLLRYDVEPVVEALSKVDRAVAVAQAGVLYIKRHPGLVAIAVTFLVVLRGRRVFRLAQRGFFLWKTWRALRQRFFSSGFGLS